MMTIDSDRLPEHLWRYFQEYDASSLGLESSRHTIIRRLVESGGWDAVSWLRATIGDIELREYVVHRRGRGISPKRLRFWGLVLDIPRDHVTEWIRAQQTNPWATRARLSFLEYRYPLLRPVVRWSEFNCSLASLEDLACMKLSALANRGAKKDFIDVYALGTERMSLPGMLDSYRSKYGVEDVGHVVMSLTYFDDAEAEDMPELLWDVDWQDVKSTLEGWVSDHGRRSSDG